MKAVITVIGQDKIGIIHQVTSVLTEYDVNILDINQTIMQEYFTMVMLVDTQGLTTSYHELKEALDRLGKEMELSIRIQHEDIFRSMHRV